MRARFKEIQRTNFIEFNFSRVGLADFLPVRARCACVPTCATCSCVTSCSLTMMQRPTIWCHVLLLVSPADDAVESLWTWRQTVSQELKLRCLSGQSVHTFSFGSHFMLLSHRKHSSFPFLRYCFTSTSFLLGVAHKWKCTFTEMAFLNADGANGGSCVLPQ